MSALRARAGERAARGGAPPSSPWSPASPTSGRCAAAPAAPTGACAGRSRAWSQRGVPARRGGRGRAGALRRRHRGAARDGARPRPARRPSTREALARFAPRPCAARRLLRARSLALGWPERIRLPRRSSRSRRCWPVWRAAGRRRDGARARLALRLDLRDRRRWPRRCARRAEAGVPGRRAARRGPLARPICAAPMRPAAAGRRSPGSRETAGQVTVLTADSVASGKAATARPALARAERNRG